MARIGFHKTYPAGSFTHTAVQDLLALIKTTLSSAGFNVLLDTPDGIDVIRAGAVAGSADDDTPHWAFQVQDQNPYGLLYAYSVFGHHYADPNAHSSSRAIVNSGWVETAQALTLWFAADGSTGGWWLHATQPDSQSNTGVTMRFGYAGTTSRRYPSDTHQGLCARYGIWNARGDWWPPYAKNESGTLNLNPATGTWSPFGEGWSFNAKRHPGSPLPKMAVPQFPNRDGGISACVLGEFNEILILTDGYAAEEVVVPGWIAMVGSDDDQPYAVPAPASFTVL